jgi:hypothetical protein
MPIPATVFLPQPFANNASAPFINLIPNTSPTAGRATYSEGFPPITMQEELSGGLPPLGQDFNGILNALSTHVFAQQAGQLYKYDADVAAAADGYPVGTVLESTDGLTVWYNTVDGNMDDPDANAAGWVPLYSYGYTTMAGLTGGVVTLTREEARRGVIVLAGTLVSNLQVELPNTYQMWLIVNLTTGAFSTTAKTAAGTGVDIPQGGFAAPTGVYGDSINLYPTVAPVNLPVDQAPGALTIAQRTNTGALLATQFNQSNATESFIMSALFAQVSPADGWLRKISLTDAVTQLLANPAGLAAMRDVMVGAPAQSWQYMNASRGFFANFTNNTSRPIQVSVIMFMGFPAGATLFVNGQAVARCASGGSNFDATLSAIIPVGAAYQIQYNGTLNGWDWKELR